MVESKQSRIVNFEYKIEIIGRPSTRFKNDISAKNKKKIIKIYSQTFNCYYNWLTHWIFWPYKNF